MLSRSNLAQIQRESWRPPIMSSSSGFPANFFAWARRLLDLQLQSIWMDLKVVLAGVRGTIVDVGCGAQPYRPLLPKNVEYIGIDTADAKEHFGYESPNTIYFQGDRWPIADKSATAVMAVETLEHVPDPRGFLREAHRCLAPGGLLILTVPFAARWHFIPHDYWRFTPSSLNMLLRESGFQDVQVYARGNAVAVASYKAMALIFPLLFPQKRTLAVGLLFRAAGLLLTPALALLAIIGRLSLSSDGGDDCLGYTVLAKSEGGVERLHGGAGPLK